MRVFFFEKIFFEKFFITDVIIIKFYTIIYNKYIFCTRLDHILFWNLVNMHASTVMELLRL